MSCCSTDCALSLLYLYLVQLINWLIDWCYLHREWLAGGPIGPIKNSSAMAYGLWRIAGPSAFLSNGTMLKSDKISCSYSAVNCIRLRTFWTPLVDVNHVMNFGQKSYCAHIDIPEVLVHCELTQVHTPFYDTVFGVVCSHCCERNFEYLNWLSTRTCGAGRPHVWLCHAPLVVCFILLVIAP